MIRLRGSQRGRRLVEREQAAVERERAGNLQQLPVRVMRVTHLFPTALPGITAYRWVQQAWPSWRETPRSDLRPLPGVVNETLAGVCALEARLLRQTDFLFGSSLMAVVKKDG